MKARIATVLILFGALWFGPFVESASAQADTDWEFRVYFPTGSSTAADPLRLEITVVVNGNPVTKTVEVAGIAKWDKPARVAGQTPAQYLQMLADSAAVASQAKAEIILIRINQAFAAEFAQLDGGKGRLAEFGTYAQALKFNPSVLSDTKIVPAKPTDTLKADGNFGLINLPNVSSIRVLSERDRTGRVIRGNPTGEAGNAGRPIPRPTRIRGVMSRGIGDAITFATGFDPYGDPSLVTFGIDGSFVASMTPTPGMTDEDILRELGSLLTSNGIPTTFDPAQVALSLDAALSDGQAFMWGTDDPGLDFGAFMEAIAVPAPATGTLIAAGLLAVLSTCWLRDKAPSRRTRASRHPGLRP